MEQGSVVEKPRKKWKPLFILFSFMGLIGILSIIIFILIGTMTVYDGGDNRRRRALVQVKKFESALDLYFTDNILYPTTQQGLQALVTAPIPVPKNFPPVGYMKSIPTDPWGHPYIYRSPGVNRRPYTIVSYGADGVAGGKGEDADIESWNLETRK